MSEVRAADLGFTVEETATFLNAAMGLSLSGPDIAPLDARTEGWIAGLQLAVLSIAVTGRAGGRNARGPGAPAQHSA